jgi:hypothetical protein
MAIISFLNVFLATVRGAAGAITTRIISTAIETAGSHIFKKNIHCIAAMYRSTLIRVTQQKTTNYKQLSFYIQETTIKPPLGRDNGILKIPEHAHSNGHNNSSRLCFVRIDFIRP